MAEGGAHRGGEGADIIDINMGCPAKKVTGGYAGSALMRDLDHALSLIEAVVGAVDVPVTVKMRLGWDDGSAQCARCWRAAPKQAGVQHGDGPWPHALPVLQGQGRLARHRRGQGRRSSIPVVANGDVATPADAADDARPVRRRRRDDRPRRATARPGSPGAIAAGAAGERRAAPAAASDWPTMSSTHYEDMLALYGVESGLRQARKHLGWYLDRHAPAAPPRLRAGDHDRARDPAQTVAGAARRAFDDAGGTTCEEARMNVQRRRRRRRMRRRPDRAEHDPPAGHHGRAGRHDHLRQCRRRGLLPRQRRRCWRATTLGALRAVRQPDPDAGRPGARAPRAGQRIPRRHLLAAPRHREGRRPLRRAGAGTARARSSSCSRNARWPTRSTAR